MCDRKQNWYGMNWCRQSTRLAIYLRDGLACVWCGRGVEEGIRLSLDHLKPVNKGGSNEPGNLLTACTSCNYARKDMSVPKFARILARERHLEPFMERVAHYTVRRVRAAVRRSLPREDARRILALRGSLSDFLESLAENVPRGTIKSRIEGEERS